MSLPQILVGSDPEVFVKKDGQFICAHNLIPGTKDFPHKVDKGAVQVDGFALEFNIDPAKDVNEFILNHKTVMRILASMVPGYEIHAVPVADFTKEYMDSCPAEAKVLGCDPDFDAYTGMANEKPQADLPMRTASGHVHIGWDKDLSEHHDMARAVALQMDAFLGVPSVLYDDDVRRRTMYGKAGCYRLKPYGMEYRTLSNKWLRDENLMAWVFNQVQEGMKQLMTGNSLYHRFGSVQDIINNSDKAAAQRFIKEAGIQMA